MYSIKVVRVMLSRMSSVIGGVTSALADHEERGAGALGHVALLVEEDRAGRSRWLWTAASPDARSGSSTRT